MTFMSDAKKHNVREKRSDGIFRMLQREIISGVYPPNSRFPAERDLAEGYGVSRVTVREAVAGLRQLGLVTTLPQSGTYVTDFYAKASFQLLIDIMNNSEIVDAEIITSLMEFRRVNEVYTIRCLTPGISTEDLEKLRSILEAKRKAGLNIGEISRRHYEMHHFFNQKAPNLVLRLLFNSFKPVYKYYIDLFFTLPGSVDYVIRNYDRLLAAMEARDADYAAFLMDEILRYGENRIKELLGLYQDVKQVKIR